MKVKFYPYAIKLKEEFTLSGSSRSSTPAVMVEIDQDGLTGFGEASLPPYLPENQKSVIEFIKSSELDSFNVNSELDWILDYITDLSEGNNAAKAALDIALHDLAGKLNSIPLYKYLNITKREDIVTSFTIGITKPDDIKRKINAVSHYKILKIKLGTDTDKEIVATIRKHTDKPLFVDVNQGWSDRYFALDMIGWLSGQNVLLVEQTLPKEKVKDLFWLKEKSPLPIIADEAVQNLNDLEKFKDVYSGFNIKLMKAGGIRQAYRMIQRAKELNLKIMIECMTETSCAITAASHLSPLADWVDLDGAELISNDLFIGMKMKNGKIVIPDQPGLGIKRLSA